jgi:antitoxin component YwqK of YwqJK toxin-antitoxin module
MFAIVASYLPSNEGDELRTLAGDVVFNHTDKYGNTYKNGLLHSYNDQPAYINGKYKVWYRNGIIHSEGDYPALIYGELKQWYQNGLLHREHDLPAYIRENITQWYKNGVIHSPAYIQGDFLKEWKTTQRRG